MPASRQRSLHSPGLRRFGPLALALCGVLAIPVVLAAHAHLRRSEPAARERLTTPPTAIRLWFSERPQLAFTRVRLRAADSTEIALGAVAAMAGDPSGVTAPLLGTLPNGDYLVLWQTGGADGHPMRGTFPFIVAVAADASVSPAASRDTAAPRRDGHAVVRSTRSMEPPSLNAYVAARWAEFVALLAVVGAIVFRALAARVTVGSTSDVAAGSAAADAARRLGQGALVLAGACALARLYAEAALMLGGEAGVDRAAVTRILGGTTWGAGWIIGFAGIVVAAVGFALASRGRVGWLLASAGVFAMAIAPGLTGHAAATQPVALALAADVVHVLAAGIWLGTLLIILLVGVPFLRASDRALGPAPQLAALVRGFHPVALACATAVVLSGLVTSWLRLPSVAALWESMYGRVLLLKVGLVLLVVVLGAVNWRRLLPALGRDDAVRVFRRTAGAELAFAALVLFATALLGSLAPPEAPSTTASPSASADMR